MSLLPLIFDEVQRPLRLFDQHFGVNLDADDLVAPLNMRSLMRGPHGYYIRPWASTRSGSGSTITADKDKFQVNLDVQQFAPEEITVRASGDNCIVIEGRHEEKPDEHGYISRHFVRKYLLPKGHDINQVVSNLSTDGVLTISAPRVSDNADNPRLIHVQQTGAPHKPIKEAVVEPKKK